MNACQAGVVKNMPTPRALDKIESQQHDYEWCALQRDLDKLLRQRIRRIGDDRVDLRAHRQQEIDLGQAIGTASIVQITGEDIVPSSSQDFDDVAGAGRRLPYLLWQLLAFEQGMNRNGGRIVKISPMLSQWRSLNLAGVI